jgi:hypothetical protein
VYRRRAVPELDRIQHRPLNAGWSDVTQDFLPWLAENISVLSQSIDLPLSLINRDHPIGADSLDLFLEDDVGRRVIVDTQLVPTTDCPLGKLLSYCACTEAKVVIWIAEQFKEEHLLALEWLNHNSLMDIGFFAVELHLGQIGQSPLAPDLRVAVRPNKWAKWIRTEAQVHRAWSGFGNP